MLTKIPHEAPFFSVVIPCFNRLAEVKFSLQSVLRQTYSDYECIVIDDGSEDGEQLFDLVESLNDSRFQYIYQENSGGGAARNAGIRAARGQYIAFLDSDDGFLPHKLEKAKSIIEEHGFDALYSQAYVDRGSDKRYWVRPDRGIESHEDVGEYLFVHNQFIQTSTIIIKATIAKSVLFDPSLRKGQDLDLCVRLHAAGIRFSMIDEPLVIWRDVSELGRTSRHSGVDVCEQWLNKNVSLLTYKAAVGYRSTVLSYYQPKWKLFTVVVDLTKGVVLSGVPLRVTLRQLCRFILPRRVYRIMVDSFVKGWGTSKDSKLHHE